MAQRYLINLILNYFYPLIDMLNLNFREIATASMILFAVIDIIGSIPIVIDLKAKVGRIQSKKASIVAGILMILFLFLGKEILNLIGIDVNSFAVAGSLILFFLALEMILGITLYKDEEPATAAVVPLAFPLIAGAGTMTTLLSLRAEYEAINIIVAIVINIVFVYIAVSYTHLRAHETDSYLVCRLLLE